MNNYKDIINLPYHKSKKRPRMSIEKRAGQFAPFSALTGYDEQIKETARLTDKRVDIDDGKKSILNYKLNIIKENLNKKYTINIKYFKEDKLKNGGKYLNHIGIIKKIDEMNKMIEFQDGYTINIVDVFEIISEELKLET